MKYHIGIDPGKDGAISIISPENKIESFVIPKIGKEVDIHELVNIVSSFKGLSCHVVLEDVHAIFGSAAKSTFSFGHTNGLIEGVLVSLKIPYTKIQPKKWQEEMFVGVPTMKKPDKISKKTKKVVKGKNDTKGMALYAVKRLFPNAVLLETSRCHVPHDGIVDALLLAEYSRRKFK